MHFIPEELDEYVVNHSEDEPHLLHLLNRETNQKILQPRMLSGHYQGRLLSILSKLINPKHILEIGTYTGYSALCLAEGMQADGELHTIDINEELYDFQRKYFDKSPYGKQIQQHVGNALDIIPKLAPFFDLVFIDADKENYLNYFNCVIDKLNPGGIILSDNVLWSGKVLDSKFQKEDTSTPALIAYNKLLKTDDRVEINSLLGKKFSNNLIGNWSYSSFINFKTQWTKGFRYSNSNGEETKAELSRFFSPAYLQLGIGLYWRKSKDLWINFAPFTGRLILVNKDFTQNLVDGKTYFGVKKGENSRFELGASLSSYYKVQLLENVELENRLGLYSDYLKNAGNIDLDYTIIVIMNINKYLTTNLIFQFIYDDNSIKRLQVREVLGIGLSLDI